jgi:hypothetical protein
MGKNALFMGKIPVEILLRGVAMPRNLEKR